MDRTFFYANYNKKSVIAGKNSVNLEITYMENYLHSMSNYYPRFPDISALITPMPMCSSLYTVYELRQCAAALFECSVSASRCFSR